MFMMGRSMGAWFVLVVIGIFLHQTKYSCAHKIYLKNGWTIVNGNKNIELVDQTIPSGVYSALEEANLTESVLFSYNDVTLRWIAKDNWTYCVMFPAPENINAYHAVVLVFDGIDTVADIFLNGHQLTPSPRNMFVRYQYDIRNSLKNVNNHLEVVFQSPIEAAKKTAKQYSATPPECPPDSYKGECHANFLRKMQASFSWDWGLAAPSIGIWYRKPVSIEYYDTAIIRDVNYALRLDNDFWQIDVKVFLEVPYNVGATIEGYLTTDIQGILDEPIWTHVLVTNLKDEEFQQVITLNVPKSRVSLWWPNGYGHQILFPLTVRWRSENRDISTNNIVNAADSISIKTVNIGFRTIEIIESPLDSGKSFYFKINGVPIFMKGTNWIPSHILPEKSFDKDRVNHLLMSAQNAHMNMIRVWGGGIYETDHFYDMADKLGILIWQDMMFACAMYPVFDDFLDSVRLEIKQNIRRIQSHPSIAIWAGNNENEAALMQNWYGTRTDHERFAQEYVQLYSLIKDTITDVDQYHIWTYSSPSNGIQNTTILNSNPQDDFFGDIHFYNYLMNGWNSNIFPKPRFVSEYGFQSLPSLSSWQSVRGLNNTIPELINHRQHFVLGNTPVISLIRQNLPLPDVKDLKYTIALIYFSQVSQAMATKTETEAYRVGRGSEAHTMGALYWQLNDVWVAPSWSSIEFNGNYKILQNWAEEFFAPIHVVAQIDLLNNVNVHVIRDSLGKTKSLQVIMTVFKWNDFVPVSQRQYDIQMSENTVQLIDHFHVNEIIKGTVTKQNSFLQFQLIDTDSFPLQLSQNFLFLDHIKDAIGVQNPSLELKIIGNTCNSEESTHVVFLEVKAKYPAIFVYIHMRNPIIGRKTWSKNGFMLTSAVTTVSATFQNPNCSIQIDEFDFEFMSVNEFMKQ